MFALFEDLSEWSMMVGGYRWSPHNVKTTFRKDSSVSETKTARFRQFFEPLGHMATNRPSQLICPFFDVNDNSLPRKRIAAQYALWLVRNWGSALRFVCPPFSLFSEVNVLVFNVCPLLSSLYKSIPGPLRLLTDGLLLVHWHRLALF